MEADHLRMKLHHEIAHFFVEGSASGLWNGSIFINLQLGVIGIQALYPVPFPSTVVSRRLVAIAKVLRACGAVGVGIAMARDPLRRSGQALLTHPAPTLGDDA